MYSEIEKKERRKIIGISIILAVVILFLVVAIVVVATSKTNKTNVGGDSNATLSIAEETESKDNESKTEEKTETKTENKSDSNSSDNKSSDSKSSSKTTVTTKTTNNTVSVSNDSKSLPDTGPEDFFPIALMSGALVAYIASEIMAKRQ